VQLLVGAADEVEQFERPRARRARVVPVHEEQHRALEPGGVGPDARARRRRPVRVHQAEHRGLEARIASDQRDAERRAHRQAAVRQPAGVKVAFRGQQRKRGAPARGGLVEAGTRPLRFGAGDAPLAVTRRVDRDRVPAPAGEQAGEP
jgi:hypothetical protein